MLQHLWRKEEYASYASLETDSLSWWTTCAAQSPNPAYTAWVLLALVLKLECRRGDASNLWHELCKLRN